MNAFKSPINHLKKRKYTYLVILSIAYMIILFRITVFRSSFGLDALFQNGTISLTLFQNYIPLLRQQRWFRFIYLFIGNIIWFVPFGGMFLVLGRAKRIPLAVLSGFLLSLTIEAMQYVFGTGVSELDDLILNTFGTWIGIVLVQNLKG